MLKFQEIAPCLDLLVFGCLRFPAGNTHEFQHQYLDMIIRLLNQNVFAICAFVCDVCGVYQLSCLIRLFWFVDRFYNIFDVFGNILNSRHFDIDGIL